jgi:hypothetical protein
MHKLHYGSIVLQETGSLVIVLKKYPFAMVQMPDDAAEL